MNQRLIRLSVVVFVTGLGVGYAVNESDAQTVSSRPVGRIAVTAKGAVTFDGTTVTVDALRVRLADLRKRDGVVWYYREAASGPPPPQAAEVIKLVVEQRLAISMSTKPDYSDVLLPDGTTRARDPSGRP
jgi:hypothetical protein